ncbi:MULTISPECIES: FxsA family protein [Vibrio]|uniref:Exclusion suppressor FxsA n=1 Tax=Vibrio coralliilyticus TaxID=190893 RepID=A0AAE5ERA2_9VIBR|nr:MULTISPECIES: FxsA family protein [Vibrio]MCM5509568.1 membrane protein FxsA [Vibrio sp. SCSIO 43169]NOH64018.1 membrane protein FxsA [Vibrio sp. RE88]AIW20225.1 exclusion suppressor FxsA [Vibrio coralliilyticus]ANW24114.1 membrane protein FxsA [Vibrio coralliilyticus]EEX30647.1 protein affecting phage T7 exclusion by the F plasmid [Vibrio coralliilyticus ATCC BAA-450]
MFPILLLMFIFVPIIEIGLFISVGGYLGLWPTIALVLITAFVGASLVRSQGLQTLMSVQNRLQQGELPAQQILEGVMLAVSGVLLLTPGFMTDALGMLVLLPAPRAAMAKYLMSKMTVQSVGGGFQGGFGSGNFQQGPFDQDPFNQQPKDGNTFEGEYERKDGDDNNRLN